MRFNELYEFGSYSIDNTFIIARNGLPEQTRGRIPGAVVTIEEPPPVGNGREQYPRGTAESGGKMGNAGADRNHQIEAGDQSRGLGEIGEMLGQIDDVCPFKQDRLILRSRVLLQAYEGRSGDDDTRQGS